MRAPNAIPNMNYWYRADSIHQSDSTTVSSWPDSGPSGFTATVGAGAGQPQFRTSQLNGYPAIHFSHGTGSFYTTSADSSYLGTPGFTLCVVTSIDTLSPAESWFGATSGGVTFRWASTGKPQLFINGVTTGNATNALSAGTWSIVTCDFTNTSGGAWHHYTNGTANGNGTSTNIALAGATTDLGSASSSLNPSAFIADLIAFNRVLSTIERAEVHTYLSDKYAISVSDYLSTEFSSGSINDTVPGVGSQLPGFG